MKVRFGVSVISRTAFPHRRELDKFAELIRIIDGSGVELIGTKPGEKMHEELINEEEVRRTVELPKFFAVTPAFKGVYQSIRYDYPNLVSSTVTRPYNSASEPALSRDDLARYLHRHSLLRDSNAHPEAGWRRLRVADRLHFSMRALRRRRGNICGSASRSRRTETAV